MTPSRHQFRFRITRKQEKRREHPAHTTFNYILLIKSPSPKCTSPLAHTNQKPFQRTSTFWKQVTRLEPRVRQTYHPEKQVRDTHSPTASSTHVLCVNNSPRHPSPQWSQYFSPAEHWGGTAPATINRKMVGWWDGQMVGGAKSSTSLKSTPSVNLAVHASGTVGVFRFFFLKTSGWKEGLLESWWRRTTSNTEAREHELALHRFVCKPAKLTSWKSGMARDDLMTANLPPAHCILQQIIHIVERVVFSAHRKLFLSWCYSCFNK